MGLFQNARNALRTRDARVAEEVDKAAGTKTPPKDQPKDRLKDRTKERPKQELKEIRFAKGGSVGKRGWGIARRGCK